MTNLSNAHARVLVRDEYVLALCCSRMLDLATLLELPLSGGTAARRLQLAGASDVHLSWQL